MRTLHLYFDGGTIHGSFKLYDDRVDEAALIHHQAYEMDGIADSNQAEFTVLLRALRWATVHVDTHPQSFLKLYGDCRTVHTIVGKHVNGQWKGEISTREVYNYLAAQIRTRLEMFGGHKYTNVTRATIKQILGH